MSEVSEPPSVGFRDPNAFGANVWPALNSHSIVETVDRRMRSHRRSVRRAPHRGKSARAVLASPAVAVRNADGIIVGWAAYVAGFRGAAQEDHVRATHRPGKFFLR